LVKSQAIFKEKCRNENPAGNSREYYRNIWKAAVNSVQTVQSDANGNYFIEFLKKERAERGQSQNVPRSEGKQTHENDYVKNYSLAHSLSI